MVRNPVEQSIEHDRATRRTQREVGPVAQIARKYDASSSGEPGKRLLGFLLSLNYNELSIVTCDPWKRACGGVPRNSFVMVKLSETAVGEEDRAFCDRVIMARVTDSVPTPVERDIQGAVFQLHKVQAMPDPVTAKELQWSALKASVVGTYYDEKQEAEELVAAFGNDVDTFFAPHAYAVFVPTAEDLAALVNSFVSGADPLEIGRLRYTETPRPGGEGEVVPVRVDPKDFVGQEYGNRTALFGKTRMGKSNTIKVIADTILSSNLNVGQVIFDPSGEYTYINPQDRTSLYAMHAGKCVRYSLSPREIASDQTRGFRAPKSLKINFYESVPVGHALIKDLWESEWFSDKPGYVQPVLNWTPPNLQDEPKRTDYSAYNHFWRTMSMWFAALKLANYTSEPGMRVSVEFPKNVKSALMDKLGTRVQDENGKFAHLQRIETLPAIYKEVAKLWKANGNDKGWFENSDDGSPYFNDIEGALLEILEDEGTKRGKRYFTPFRKYHDATGSDPFKEISEHTQSGKTVFIDLARANEQVRRNLSEGVCQRILGDMMRLFSEDKLEGKFVVLYFEEAHELFPAADRDLNNIYNKLAKEGAKFNVSMVYATQSMTTLSPDLLKNTENFFIAHLDDDREVKEVTRRYVFRDLAEDVQRTMSKGFVRMITQSHRFALPVQIRKFEPRDAATPGDSTDGNEG
jgi:DNA helicase HerA-like ATPase